jgi:hypothetical protein
VIRVSTLLIMRVSYSLAVWQRLVEAYRVVPGNYSQAALRAQCGVAMAKSAWEKGWATNAFPTKALKIQFEEEAEARVRAKRMATIEAAERSHEERVRAREEAIKARSDETKTVSMARAAVMGLTAAGLRLGSVANAIALELEARYTTRQPDGQRVPNANMTVLSVSDLRTMLSTTRAVVRDATVAARTIIEAQRVLDGEPLETIRVQVDEMSPEVQAATLEHMYAELRKLAGINDGDAPAKPDVSVVH